jgi:uroporphyrinogen decarboxylase
MYREPKAWNALMEKLSAAMASYLRAQIQAGVDAVQLFDSWMGCLNSQDYEQYVLPHSQRIFSALEGTGAPKIHFGTGTSDLLDNMKRAGGDVIGIDWRIPLDVAWQRLGNDVAIQGNLDPAILLADFDLIKFRAGDILKRVDSTPGHIFNLGHGMLPDANLQSVINLVQFVHSATRRI